MPTLLSLVFITIASSPDVEPPRLVEDAPVVIPEGAIPDDEAREVKLLLEIDAQGLVRRIDVIDSAGPVLDDLALGAATRMRFQPATHDGVPIAVRIHYSLRFEGASSTRKESMAPVTGAVESAVAKETSIVRGVVKRAGSSHAVVGAEVSTVRVDDVSRVVTAYTDADGRFTLTLDEGTHTLEVTAPGFEIAGLVVDARARDVTDVRIALYRDAADPFTTEVKARRQKSEVSRVTLSRGELSAIPGTGGDPLRVIESLPGVARTPLLGGALVVRGGQPGDTAVFLDGVPIPQLLHFGALTSVVHPRFLESIDFHPGGFPVRYGRATAGVVDARTHALAFEGFEGMVDVDLLDAGFFFAGPIVVEGWPRIDFAVAARKSVLADVAGPALSLADGAGMLKQSGVTFVPVPSFDDAQVKIELRPHANHRFSLLFFSSSDRVTVVGDPPPLATGDEDGSPPVSIEDFLNRALGSRFVRLVGAHEMRLGSRVRHTTQPYVGFTEKGFLADGVLVPAFTGVTLSAPTSSLDAGLRDDLSVAVARPLTVRAGIDLVGQTLGATLGPPIATDVPCTVSEADSGACFPAETMGYDITGTLLSLAGYGELRLGPISGLTLTQGVRVEQTSVSFADTRREFRYADAGLAQQRTWSHIDPRTSLRVDVARSFAFKGSIGTYRRWPRLESALLQTNAPDLVEPRAVQVMGGIEAALSSSVGLDAQLYVVQRDLLVRDLSRQFKGSSLMTTPSITQPGEFDNLGTGQTVGLDVLWRHQPTEWFFGWLAYTLSRTWQNTGEELDPFHPAPFDTTHNFIAVGRVNLPFGFVAGGRFQFTSGAPSAVHDSLTVVQDVNTGTYSPLPSTLRRPRLPPYHRLDVRLDRRFVFEHFALSPSLELINAYAYPNVELTVPGGDFRSRGTVAAMPGVPPLVMFGLQAEF